MQRLRFALVGCGRVAKNHVGAIRDNPRCELVALCDLMSERAQGYAQELGLPVYTDYHEMLAKESVDVVSLLTPSGMHPRHAVDILTRHGKHLVIEKPMALALDDLELMRAAAEAAGAKIFPIYQNRYNRAVQRVRQDLAGNRLGRLVLGTVRVRWCRPQSYYDRDPWRGTWALDGGALTNQGIHYLDLLQYLAGDVETVFARTETQLVTAEVEDTGVGILRFAAGAPGVVEVTTAARPHDFEASVSLLCERGTVVLAGLACNEIAVHTLDPQAAAEANEVFPDAYGFGHWPFFAEVAGELLDGTPHSISFAEGCRAVRLLNALYRSAEDQQEVALGGDCASRRLGRRDLELEALYLPPSWKKS